MPVIYVQTTRNYQTKSQSWTPIPELSLELPEGLGEQALITPRYPNRHFPSSRR
jgi:hypothetical protein